MTDLARPVVRRADPRGRWKQAAAADVERCLAAGEMVEARDGSGSTPLY